MMMYITPQSPQSECLITNSRDNQLTAPPTLLIDEKNTDE